MSVIGRSRAIFLFLGDLFFLYFSLWITLSLRYFKIPSLEVWNNHFIPFTILFILFLIIYFIAGFYESKFIFLKHTLISNILNVHLIFSFIAVSFFYFIRFFSITPKTSLFIFLLVSLILIILWRTFIDKFVFDKQKDKALFIYRGKEFEELIEEIKNNNYGISVFESINLENFETFNINDDINNYILENNIKFVLVNSKKVFSDSVTDKLYKLIFLQVQFVELDAVFESVFYKIPINSIENEWFFKNIKLKPHIFYDVLKRFVDIIISLFLIFISSPFYFFVFVLVKIDDRGNLFYFDKRVGQNNKTIKIIKFRTMEDDSLTRVGKFLRKTRIDELPQLVNVLKGELSLVGPRPEQVDKVLKYKEEISYYDSRLLIKPGLTGWAQIYHDNHPHHKIDIEATREKLSYDLYYIKHRSFLLDLKIALKTLKVIFLSKGE